MAVSKYDYLDMDHVIDQYVNHKKTVTQITQELGLDGGSSWFLRERLKRAGISIRKSGTLKAIDLTGRKIGKLTVF